MSDRGPWNNPEVLQMIQVSFGRTMNGISNFSMQLVSIFPFVT